MRLLFLNAVGAIGGAERSLLTMLESLRKLDSSIEISLVVGTEGALIEAAKKLGVRVFYLPLPQSINRVGDSGIRSHFSKLKLLLKAGIALPQFFGYLQQLYTTIQTVQPDLIHSNSIKTHILLASLPRIQAPIVWHIHDFYGSRPLVAQILRWLGSSATGAIAVSNAVAQDTKRLLSHLPIQVIYNAVSVGSIRDRSTQDQRVQIGLVATFARWKGHDVFLKAASQVVKQLPDFPIQFLIVGAPIYQTQGSQFTLLELQSEVDRLGLDRHVQFLGFQSEMADIYQSLDIVVHASTQPEPFGLVIAEAMAFGKAVIMANTGGAAELITPNEDAIALPPANVHALAQALIQLIQNPQQRQQLGENARRTAIARFNSDQLGAALLQVYRDCGGVDSRLEKV